MSTALRHLRPPRPIRFPETELIVPESRRHFELRTLLYAVLKTMRNRHTLGSDQFVYYDASDPTRRLAPDAFVRAGEPDADIVSWKTWERGAPHLGVEIVRAADRLRLAWDEKLERYHAAGVVEVVRFDPAPPRGPHIRVWDRVRDDLVERVVTDDSTPCVTLELHWVVRASDIGPTLRLARDREGSDLLLTSEEAALARVAELEAELRRRGG